MEIQRRDVYRILAQFFSDQMYRDRYGVPVHWIMLAAGVHLSAVAVDDFHALSDVLAAGGEVGAIGLVHGITEIGGAPHSCVRD